MLLFIHTRRPSTLVIFNVLKAVLANAVQKKESFPANFYVMVFVAHCYTSAVDNVHLLTASLSSMDEPIKTRSSSSLVSKLHWALYSMKCSSGNNLLQGLP